MGLNTMMYISAVARARNSKFGTRIDHQGTIVKMQNWVKRVIGGHVIIFGNFGTPSLFPGHVLGILGPPSVSRQSLELETPNLARGLITRGTVVNNAKLDQRRLPGVT